MSARTIARLFAGVERRVQNHKAIAEAWDRSSALLFVVGDADKRRWRTLGPDPRGTQFNLTYWDTDGAHGHMGFVEARLHEAVSYGLEGGGRIASPAERAEFERLALRG